MFVFFWPKCALFGFGLSQKIIFGGVYYWFLYILDYYLEDNLLFNKTTVSLFGPTPLTQL